MQDVGDILIFTHTTCGVNCRTKQRRDLLTQELQQMNSRARESVLEIFTLANS